MDRCTMMVKCMYGGLLLMATILMATAQERQAIAVVKGPSVTGNITFKQEGKKVNINGVVTGLAKGLHGFHIHEKGDLSNGCASTGSHFNPEKKNHGSPHEHERHVGDLGNIEANEQGVAYINITDEKISFTNPKRNVLGRAVVIHSDPDDLGRGGQTDSLTTGHAGSRVACGVIGTLNVDGSNRAFSITTKWSAVLTLAVMPYLL